jgi:hypothetical protein
LEQKVLDALENPVVLDYAVDLDGKRYQSARPPVKYIEGTLVPRQKGRAYDLSHGGLPGGLQKQQHKKQPPGFNSSRRKGAIV